MQLAILDDYKRLAFEHADWSDVEGQVKITVFDHHLGDDDAVVEALKDFQIVTCIRERTRFPATVIGRLPKLELIVTAGMRNRGIDMAAARDAGVIVSGTPSLGYPAFEHTWALILGLAKNLPREDRIMHAGGWQAELPVTLKNKTLGILGLGKLGSQVAAVGKAFGMRVIAWSQNLTEERAAEHGVQRVEKEALFSESDFITVQLVLSDRTRDLVGKQELGWMKPSAYLINTSRGPIVNEAALIQALRDQTIAGAGLDVYDIEPLPASHPLRTLDNAILTGHTGYGVAEAFKMFFPAFVEAVEAYLDGRPIRVLNGVV
ncbi:MAG: D-2-hydroxyacid dehydrogenase family protein [Gammaproteobacteria bacterium]|nr:D-2-hydroxyacid dehydrogenase family protein [Gammaproteobacteria bacterium]